MHSLHGIMIDDVCQLIVSNIGKLSALNAVIVGFKTALIVAHGTEVEG